MESITTTNPREAAYLALLSSAREESFLSDTLRVWKSGVSISEKDYHFAREIAYGTTRMASALDHLALQLAEKKKLSLKLKEKLFFRMALYQYFYMERVPLYAIVDEIVQLAKKYCHESFAKFLNACLRSLEKAKPELPKGDTVPDLSIRYSYPAFYVQELVQNFGLEKAEALMRAGNNPSPTMFRMRPEAPRPKIDGGIDFLAGTHSPIGVIKDSSLVPEIAKSHHYYIQNVTPSELIFTLAQELPEPRSILDLCASPGGKLIAAHDYFPNAELFANDVSPDKLKPLSENCEKYGVQATLSSFRGEQYPVDQKFDLVILDVPCSNSGVLNKRPEARWRLSQKTMEHLEEIQLQLVRHALDLIFPEGEVWYMTCSVLKRENNRLIDKICRQFPVEVRKKEAFLPNLDGWDGGFACALKFSDDHTKTS